MKLVTVKESHYQADLVMLKGRLESEGIECRLKNELTTQVLNYLPAFLVELQVFESDLPRVKEIMIETGELQTGEKIACPECTSEKIKMKLGVLKSVQLLFALIGVMLFNSLPADKLFRNAKYKCEGCGFQFQS